MKVKRYGCFRDPRDHVKVAKLFHGPAEEAAYLLFIGDGGLNQQRGWPCPLDLLGDVL